MGQCWNFGAVKSIFLLLAVLTLGACTSSGVVPKDMNLSVANVVVSQTGSMSESKRFLHELREEIRYEFSRARTSQKRAKLTLELRELAYEDLNFFGGIKNHSRMESFGRLEYVANGKQIGEFSVKVSVPNNDTDMGSPHGRAAIRAELLKKMASATLAEVYGKTRAIDISNSFAQYSREPFFVQVAGPISLLRNHAELPTDFSIAPEAVKTPVIIAAPQLPVDAPQVIEDRPEVANETPVVNK